MGVRPVIRVFRLALLLLAAGCHLPDASRSEVTVARAAAPDAPPTNLPAITEPPGSLPTRPASAVQPKSVSPGEFLPPIPALLGAFRAGFFTAFLGVFLAAFTTFLEAFFLAAFFAGLDLIFLAVGALAGFLAAICLAIRFNAEPALNHSICPAL